MRKLVVVLALIAWLEPVPAANGHNEEAPHNESTQSSKAKEREPAQPTTLIPQNSSNCEPGAHNAESNKQSSARPPHNLLESLNAISTLIIAIFAVVTAIAVICQVITARKSERAWILVETATIDKEWHGKSAIRPIVKNSGRTVARIRKISLGGARPLQLNEELPSVPAYEGDQEMDFVLPPNGELPISYIPKVPINNENIQTVKDGLLKMCVYGLIEYLDFTGKNRVTGFCLMYNWGKNDVMPGFYPYSEAPPAYTKAT